MMTIDLDSCTVHLNCFYLELIVIVLGFPFQLRKAADFLCSKHSYGLQFRYEKTNTSDGDIRIELKPAEEICHYLLSHLVFVIRSHGVVLIYSEIPSTNGNQ
jgi:hypothetical protein